MSNFMVRQLLLALSGQC